uniref:RNA helicase n=1 Tax=Elaeis guineensis var. tenera TaxID=51953 RepID=A0A8N4F4J6_ELAGV|nr:DEAD-box ATP-dependent RNA helicase 7-like [Elaeis guineensis]
MTWIMELTASPSSLTIHPHSSFFLSFLFSPASLSFVGDIAPFPPSSLPSPLSLYPSPIPDAFSPPLLPSELDELKKLKHKKFKNDNEGSEKKISKKKRKASDEYRNDTIFDVVARANGFALKKLKLRKHDEDEEVIASREDEDAANPNAMSKFRISKVLREKLKSKGIESLFPIQAMTYDSILDGSDLVDRYKEARKTGCGRPLSVLVLLPTRELVNQDHIERGTLDLKFLKFRILDEADEMLNKGFVDDVELILGKVEDVHLSLLFLIFQPFAHPPVAGEHRRNGIKHENYVPDEIDQGDDGGYGIDSIGGGRKAVLEGGEDDNGDRAIDENADALHGKDSGDEGPAGLLAGILREFAREKRG